MAKCSKCGVDVENPTKTWTLRVIEGRPVTIGLFRCPEGHVFRAGIERKERKKEKREEKEIEKKKKWYEFWK